MLRNVSFLSYFCTPYYDNQYNPRITLSSSNIKDNILSPNKFNLSDGNTSLELWNKNQMDATINNNPVNKTIYSPSPSMYVEPKTAAFTGLTSSNISGSFSNGFNFYCNPDKTGNTIFFPILGYIYNDGFIRGINTGAGYWYSGSYSTSTAFRFQCDYNVIDSQNVLDRFFGLNLRPVLE